MRLMDDNELIDHLHEGLGAREDAIDIPDGLTAGVLGAARRRTARRAATAAVPVFAAAGVATAIATSTSGSPHAARGGSGGPVKAQDTAYVIKRVKAAVAADSHTGTFIRGYEYTSGQLSADGSPINIAGKLDDQYDYDAPNGSQYERDVDYNDGRPWGTFAWTWVPGADNKGDVTRTVIDPTDRTYSQAHFEKVPSLSEGEPTPNLDSSPSQVQKQLQSGQVTQKGTAIVDGRQAIALSISLPSSVPDAQRFHFTLYVDAHTYQPLREVDTLNASRGLAYSDWMPATPANIARAKDDSVPAGYTKVATTKIQG